MKCKVFECEREARYKKAKLCQKHYFRYRRNGRTELRKPRDRLVTPNGYVRVYDPHHPLTESNGYVFEHRKVAYDSRGGDISDCELCGMVDITWATCHIDHKDDQRQNNAESNLAVTCVGCNTMRSRSPQHTHKGRTSISFNGVTQTAAEWSRDSRVSIASNTIIRRKRGGATDEEALFGAKRTHANTTPKTYKPKFIDGGRVRS